MVAQAAERHDQLEKKIEALALGRGGADAVEALLSPRKRAPSSNSVGTSPFASPVGGSGDAGGGSTRIAAAAAEKLHGVLAGREAELAVAVALIEALRDAAAAQSFELEHQRDLVVSAPFGGGGGCVPIGGHLRSVLVDGVQ